MKDCKTAGSSMAATQRPPALHVVALLALAAGSVACSGGEPDREPRAVRYDTLDAAAERAAVPPLALTNVTVLDVATGSARPGTTVVIRDGRIEDVAPASNAPSDDVGIVSLDGKFVIPGLWDMHVHLSMATRSALPVLVANGVTGVRDLGGDLVEVDAWRARIDAGAMTGPRIVRAGPMLNGERFNAYQLPTGGPEQARGIVRALARAGVDFIKVHRRVPREDYFAIVEEAKEQGLAVVGHIPMTVRPEEASDAGQLIEHTETLFEGTFAGGAGPVELPGLIGAFLETDRAGTLFARFARYGEVVGRMIEAEVMLLAGTDLATAWQIPGFSLHDELDALVDAGATPLQALQAATLNPAIVLGFEHDHGSVAPGKAADLVVLDADPLEDIRNTRRIAGVVLRGTYLDRAALDALLRLGERLAQADR